MKIEARFALPISAYEFVAKGTEKRANISIRSEFIEVKFKVAIFKTNNTMHQETIERAKFVHELANSNKSQRIMWIIQNLHTQQKSLGKINPKQ